MRSRATAAALLAAISLILATCGPATPQEPVVETADGERLHGAILTGDPDVAVFLGVPYAAPPVGDGRWRPPAPLSPRPGVQDATSFGRACIQRPGNIVFYRDIAEVFGTDPALVPDLEPISEDCLYLNLWTSNLGGDELQPVLVWIYGGSNVAGSGAEPPYDGANLARRGAVVINFNYRLGVFGFLAHPELTAESEHGSSGNYALLDQIAVLEWVQRNAAAFGGDPDRVTIFGESAGGTDVGYLMASPLARGLFHRAIMQSGGFSLGAGTTLEEAEAVGEKLAIAAGAGSPDETSNATPAAAAGSQLEMLRALDAEELLRITEESEIGRINSATIDGWVLDDAPGRVFEAGAQADAELIVGFNSDEWTTMRRYWPDVTIEGFEAALRDNYGELGAQAKELYPAATDAEASAAADELMTDLWFACPSRFIADRVARGGGVAYFYEFARVVPAPGGELLGAFHGAEVPYAFDSLAKETWIHRNEVDERLADAMVGYWVRFAATGDPNGDGAPAWPVYNAETREHIIFDDRIETASGVRDERCALFDELQLLRLGTGGVPSP
jgi:para-nitrobenzyl esterase